MPSSQYKMISGMFKLIGVNKMLDKEGKIPAKGNLANAFMFLGLAIIF